MERSYASVGLDMNLKGNRELINYSEILLIQSPMGRDNLSTLMEWLYSWSRVKFHDRSKLSDILTDISQLFFVKHRECSYNF